MRKFLKHTKFIPAKIQSNTDVPKSQYISVAIKPNINEAVVFNMLRIPFFKMSIILAIAVCVIACHNKDSKQKPPPNAYDVVNKDSKEAKADTLCFISTGGTTNQDTTKLTLHLTKGDVNGDFLWMPFEKDSRKGNFAGTKKDSIISGVWRYTQEGVKDSLKIQFKLTDKGLYQQPWKVNSVNGRQELDTTAAYNIPYRQIDCKTGR